MFLSHIDESFSFSLSLSLSVSLSPPTPIPSSFSKINKHILGKVFKRRERENKMNSRQSTTPTNQPGVCIQPVLPSSSGLLQRSPGRFNKLPTAVFASAPALTLILSAPTVTASHCNLRTSSLFKTLEFRLLGNCPVLFPPVSSFSASPISLQILKIHCFCVPEDLFTCCLPFL